MKVTALIFNSKNIRKFNKTKSNTYQNDLFINIAIFISFVLIGGIFLLYRYNSKIEKLKKIMKKV